MSAFGYRGDVADVETGIGRGFDPDKVKTVERMAGHVSGRDFDGFDLMLADEFIQQDADGVIAVRGKEQFRFRLQGRHQRGGDSRHA